MILVRPGDVERNGFNGTLTGESDSPSITYFFKLKIFIVSRGDYMIKRPTFAKESCLPR